MPTAVGAAIRLPYSFAVTKFGGRNWTVVSALLLLVPCLLAAAVLEPGVSFGTLLLVAAVAGVGGGNLGVAAVQLVGLLVLATAGAANPRLILADYIPLIVLSALCAAMFMDNLTGAKADKRRT